MISPDDLKRSQKGVARELDRRQGFPTSPLRGPATESIWRYAKGYFYFIVFAAIVVFAVEGLGSLLDIPHPADTEYGVAQEHLEDAAAEQGIRGPYRIEPRAFGSVRLYVPKAGWEAIPYPDRKPALAAIASSWCKNVRAPDAKGALPSVFLPCVSIRDIREGGELAHYSCLLHGMW